MKSEDNLRASLQRLELSVLKVMETRGYVKDAKVLKALEEMIREQLNHAHTRTATRSIR